MTLMAAKKNPDESQSLYKVEPLILKIFALQLFASKTTIIYTN